MRPYPETEVGPWGMAHVTEHMPGPGASLTSNPVHTYTHTHTHTKPTMLHWDNRKDTLRAFQEFPRPCRLNGIKK
jgi:hypothetical protein